MFLTCLLDSVVDSTVGGGYQEGRNSNPDHGYEGEVGLSLALYYRARERLVLKPKLESNPQTPILEASVLTSTPRLHCQNYLKWW